MTEKQYRDRERRAVQKWRERLTETDAGLPFDPDARRMELHLDRILVKLTARFFPPEHSDLCMCVYCMGHPVLPTLAKR